jgi:hypothetical protein
MIRSYVDVPSSPEGLHGELQKYHAHQTTPKCHSKSKRDIMKKLRENLHKSLEKPPGAPVRLATFNEKMHIDVHEVTEGVAAAKSRVAK